MTIEEAEEYLQTWSSGNGDTPNAAAAEEAKKAIIDAVRKGGHVAKWIRCSERLPKMTRVMESKWSSAVWRLSDPVLVCGYGADREEGILYGVAAYETTEHCDDDDDGWCEPLDDTEEEIVEVIAWMPIPEYKEESK